MVEAITDLQNRTYNYDFTRTSDCLQCTSLNVPLHPKDFHVEETYQFEGMGNPADSSILFAISSKGMIRGILVDACRKLRDIKKTTWCSSVSEPVGFIYL